MDDMENLVKNKFNHISCMCTGTDDGLNVYITDLYSIDTVRKYIIQDLKLDKRIVNVEYIVKIPISSSGKILYDINKK